MNWTPAFDAAENTLNTKNVGDPGPTTHTHRETYAILEAVFDESDNTIRTVNVA